METLYINVGKANLTRKTGKALYLAFSFNTITYARVIGLQTKYFHPNLEMWEIPYKDLDRIQYLFSDYEIITNDTKLQVTINDYKQGIESIVSDTGEKEPFFKTKPYQHQLDSFSYSRLHHRFLLADDQGLGKTKQAIDIAVNNKHQFKHCLIICCVNSLKWNWREEIGIHSDEEAHIIGSYVNRKDRLVQGDMKRKLADIREQKDSFFLVTNMESLRNKEFLNIVSDMTISGEIGMVVIDEIHKMKNSQSIVGKAIHKLNSYYKMALTGTPLLRDAIDLYNVLKWLGEETGTLTNFKYRYCVFGGFGNREIVGYQNIEELHERLQSIQLRRLKGEVFDLPPKIHTDVYVELEPKQKRLYALIQEELIREINEIILSPNPLAKLTRLRQVTSYPAILDPEVGLGAKMRQVIDDVDEVIAQGHKVIIFSNWVSVIEGAANELKQHNPLLYTGKVKEMDRNDNKLLFQNDPERMLIMGTVGAMGTGLTLNKGSEVMFLDVPWSPAEKLQAEDRAHRIGTQHTVNVRTYITKHTVDEHIEEIVYHKSKLSNYLVDGKVRDKPRRIFSALLGVSK